MRTSDFDYELPSERIAQAPADPRDSARMLVCERASGAVRHRTVRDLPEELAAGDLLVVNDTRVLPARLAARRASGGAVELLFLEPSAPGARGHWRALVRPARKLRVGEELLGPGGLVARAIEREREPGGEAGAVWTVALDDPARPERTVEDLLERHGRVPLPPYIERARAGDARDPVDREAYQTVFAEHRGAVAAPTAGLHFTPELLGRLEDARVERASVTLHVGLGTFQPVVAEDLDEHRMHAERFVLPEATASAVAAARARGARVVAVGTTTVRVLESCAADDGRLRAGAGETRLFVRPGTRFRAIDALLTNFHLPRSTLLMLVSALLGRERTLELYAEAVRREYRFFSYGDAMLVLP